MYALDFSENGVTSILNGRAICDFLKGQANENPNNKLKYMKDLDFELAKLGFENYISFKFINASYNIYEFDNCYRVRHKDKPLTVDPPEMEVDDFCVKGSGCKKRGYPPCANEMNVEFVRCYNNNPMLLTFMDYKDSKICQEHYQAAEKLGIDTSGLFVPHPMGLIACKLLSPDTLTPIFCEGVCIKIKEPLFDLFWGMEKYFNMYEFQHNMRVMLNGGSLT